MKILMVCLGNICRSPLAEGIMAHLISQHDLSWQVGSAGTASYHAGSGPDRRSVAEAARHNLDISHQRSRQLRVQDYYDFDLILAMDAQNYLEIKRQKPEDADVQIKMILDYSDPGMNKQVPDPYYHGGFEAVYDMLYTACEKVVESHS